MMRKIYTSIAIDMKSGEVLEEESYLYDGPVAECKGGGSVDSVDEVYNARMATLSEEQQDWAREYYNVWNKYFKPYEIAQSQANMELLPLETNLYKGQLESATQLLPQQTEAAQKFLSQSLNGVDVNERMGLATADTANAWKDMNKVNARESARMGVDPNSGRFMGMQSALGTQQAAAMAGARTQARVGAEAENYDRLAKATQLSPANSAVQGMSFING